MHFIVLYEKKNCLVWKEKLKHQHLCQFKTLIEQRPVRKKKKLNGMSKTTQQEGMLWKSFVEIKIKAKEVTWVYSFDA